jgi:hypothetical protein
MKEAPQDRRLAANEAIYRKFNERMQKSINTSDKHAVMPMYFFCECSDEKCQKQIKISPEEYNKIHKDKNKFTLICSHEVEQIEDVVNKNSEYCVVKKHRMPPSPPGHFTHTDSGG